MPTHLAESENICEAITEEFLERTDGWTVAEQLLELGVAPTSEAFAVAASKLVAKRNFWRGGKGKKGNGKATKAAERVATAAKAVAPDQQIRKVSRSVSTATK